MGDTLMSVTDARAYILQQYGVSWSGWWIRKLCARGILRAVRPGGERGWVYVSQHSIDERFSTPSKPSA